MTNSYFVRITRAYSELEILIKGVWSERVEKMVVYEHVGSETEKVHIHVLIVDSQVEKKMLKTMAKTGGFTFNGNKDWSWKERKDLTDTPMIYMSKGNLMPKFLKGYTDAQAVDWAAQWVDPKRQENAWEKIVNYVLDDEYMEEKRKEYYEGIDVSKIPVEELGDLEFKFVLQFCRQMVFTKNKMVWSPNALNQYKCCVLTYVMRKGMKIPSSFKDWNKFL